jgi:two-component system, OmpR family, response regulator RegX3
MTQEARTVAILDDDPDQLLALGKWLTEAGYPVSKFERGGDLLKSIVDTPVDVALIDWGLPDMPGVEVVRRMRDEMHLDIPIIIITSRNLEQDIVEGLEAGADDYLVKPARRMECLARVEATLRRAESLRAEKATKNKVAEFGAYRFDIGAREVYFADKKVMLTEKELQLVLLLFAELGNEVSRRTIWSAIWGIVSTEVSSRTVDTHIYRLRTKMELDGQHGFFLKTLHGRGYRLSTSADNSATA